MKKLISLLLIVLLALPLMGTALADGVIYKSDFTSSTDGWYPRSAGGAKLSLFNGALMITGRAGNWHSPGREFELAKGTRYWFTVDVMQDAKDSVEFILSVEKTTNGVQSYENLTRASASRGEWTTIYGTWTAAGCDKYVLYVETDGAPMVNFCIKDFTVYTEDPQKLTSASFEGDLPSLKELYASYFDVGTCISGNDVRNASRKALVASQYSIVTPENEMKPDAVLNISECKKLAKEDETAVAVRFDSAVPILNYAQDKGLKVHGHVLVWHSQTPEEFFHEGYNRNNPYVSREVMIARLDNYIRLVFEYIEQNYPGLFVSFDVVNEAVADGSSKLRSSNWTKVVGEDFVNIAFEIADKYAPDYIMLCYNDYSTPYEPKCTGIMNLLASLAADGHIDGYGFQSHYSWNDPSIASIRKAFDKVTALGLKIRVSELDIKVNTDTDSTRAQQAERYVELFRLYMEYDVAAVQVWGVSDGTSWIAKNFPLLFDKSLQPKPAFFAVAGIVGE